VKPANIMLRPDGHVMLVDFGSARFMEGAHTHRSTLVGTFGYMPPEQLGGTVDRTSDLYALAASLLHAVTGRPPSEFLDDGMRLRVPTSVSRGLAHWLTQGFSLERGRRFQSARQARTKLDLALIAPRHRLVLATVLGVCMGLPLAAVLISARSPEVTQVPTRTTAPSSDGAQWFARVRGGCNHLEVGRLMLNSPPPRSTDGAGFGAGCYALATRYHDARKLIQALPESQRATAAWSVFEIAHPVADQGDDAAAGPMMELVLEFWPENYQARYHAGIAE
jgi:serine/threonine protein kinase